MTPEQMQSASDELRARANLHIDNAVGDRCCELAAALDNLAKRTPYAWEVIQGGRAFLLSAQEFSGKTYDCASFTPLYKD